MTDVHVESGLPKTQQVESATQTPDAELIAYDEAEREGKELVRQLDSEWRQFRLGELAHRVKPVYGEGTLRKYAEAIGIVLCTLDRHRLVYRAWADILAPGRKLSYAVARALANHPDREAIIRENPDITKREAEALMRKYRGQNPDDADEDDADEDDDDDDDDDEQAEPDDNEEQAEPDADGPDEQVSEPTWIGRRLIDANKAAGYARIEDWTQYRVDAGLMQAVEETAVAWGRLVEHLRAA
jgi:hypothetical protein